MSILFWGLLFWYIFIVQHLCLIQSSEQCGAQGQCNIKTADSAAI